MRIEQGHRRDAFFARLRRKSGGATFGSRPIPTQEVAAEAADELEAPVADETDATADTAENEAAEETKSEEEAAPSA
jgi:hypothetical protein